ncbi:MULTISPECIES: response regulator [Gimesia]|uniref:Sporulation initiation phosphotransferase F n=2 Tax=Gimesia TaxID=1649453 RepID=A0A517PX92_9PLAN|nr:MULTISPECIES: response regulator [Gimesia]MBN70134.1 response regulator [Gimesia sp.]QDT23998.1 Sporulation initiation phosphotransferase F [Gimesia chilikensis]QDU06053.1 Sporulation initiation phosphotransferase F [Gimesia chilikensis]QGQ24286.1 response regulator [Gimesia benthica]
MVKARSQTPYQLLIADDDSGFREVLREVLAPYFQLFEAESGEQAIELVEQTHVDIVLLDMHMDILTGLEAVRILKQINALLPCILITADATDELRQDASAANAYEVLSKPVKRQELVTTVSHALVDTYQDPNVPFWLGN